MVVSKSKRERFERGTQSANLVIGAVLGAYLGLGLTKTGISSEGQLGLFLLLISLSVFAALIIGLSEFLSEKKSLGSLIVYVVLIILSFTTAYVSAAVLDIDLKILRVIFIAWICLIGLEVVILGTERVVKNND